MRRGLLAMAAHATSHKFGRWTNDKSDFCVSVTFAENQAQLFGIML
jgi:hypothetical protein